MPDSPEWTKWGGVGFTPRDSSSIVFFHPRSIDVEEENELGDLSQALVKGDVFEDAGAALIALESASVSHGQYTKSQGSFVYQTPLDNDNSRSHTGTWVEVVPKND